MLRTVTHPFVPNQVAFARREVMLTRISDEAAVDASKGERCALRFLDAASNTRIRAGDCIVHRTLDEERHLWQIVKTLDTKGHDHIVLSPVGDSTRMLFGANDGAQIEALYYSRLVPAKYYLDVLALYLLNLLVANSSITTNTREKIDVESLGDRTDIVQGNERGVWDNISEIVNNPRRLFEDDEKNGLQEIFRFIAHIYVNLTCHGSIRSYYGKAVGESRGDLDPNEFLLSVVNDAKALRNMVEEFLSVPRNTFESEWPTERRLQRVGAKAERDFSVLQSAPIDIKQLLVEARREQAP